VRDWSDERRPTWAVDTGLPEGGQLGRTNLSALSPADGARVVALANAQLCLIAWPPGTRGHRTTHPNSMRRPPLWRSSARTGRTWGPVVESTWAPRPAKP
jgi:hypothetical protein